MFLGYVLPSLLMNQIPALGSAGCTIERGSGVTLAVTLGHSRMLMPCMNRPQDFFEPEHRLSLSKLHQSYTIDRLECCKSLALDKSNCTDMHATALIFTLQKCLKDGSLPPLLTNIVVAISMEITEASFSAINLHDVLK